MRKDWFPAPSTSVTVPGAAPVWAGVSPLRTSIVAPGTAAPTATASPLRSAVRRSDWPSPPCASTNDATMSLTVLPKTKRVCDADVRRASAPTMPSRSTWASSHAPPQSSSRSASRIASATVTRSAIVVAAQESDRAASRVRLADVSSHPTL